RSGVDDREFAAPDEVGQRPLEGERPGVVGEDAPQPGRDLLHGFRGEIERLIERDVVGHGDGQFEAGHARPKGPDQRIRLRRGPGGHTDAGAPRFPLKSIAERNSCRVSARSRNTPSMRLVTMVACDLWTPRVVMQVCVPSITTATPCGLSTRSMVLAISAVMRS